MISYRKTTVACYTGYVVQAIVNCLPPLLYTAFHSTLGISLAKIAVLITVNFCVQIAVDLTSAVITDRVGYRAAVLTAHIFSTLGLLSLGVLPFVLPSAFAGLLTSTILSAIGGGLLEVVISPIIEALPSKNKTGSMAFLHSFYCWGSVAVVLFSTLYFALAGIAEFRYLPMLWASVPAVNLFVFLRAPILRLDRNGKSDSPRKLFSLRIFYPLCILMLTAGASELAMAQWASFFAEEGLGVSKTAGDLLGPCLFAVLMGIGRVLFAIRGDRIDIRTALAGTSVFSVVCYLVAALAPSPIVSLLGCAFCGLSVAVMWPGVYSLGARLIPRGGTAMFAVFALFGDLGCSAGPTLVSAIAGDSAAGIRQGLLIASAFPAVMLLVSVLLRRKAKMSGKD